MQREKKNIKTETIKEVRVTHMIGSAQGIYELALR